MKHSKFSGIHLLFHSQNGIWTFFCCRSFNYHIDNNLFPSVRINLLFAGFIRNETVAVAIHSSFNFWISKNISAYHVITYSYRSINYGAMKYKAPFLHSEVLIKLPQLEIDYWIHIIIYILQLKTHIYIILYLHICSICRGKQTNILFVPCTYLSRYTWSVRYANRFCTHSFRT